MAKNLTKTQRKNRNKFVALMVAIVVVLAAIAFVVCNGLTVASFENEHFEDATAQALGQKPGSVNKNELEKVKYLEVANDGTSLQVFFGYDDYFTRLDEYMAEQEVIAAAQEESDAKLEEMRTAAMETAKAEAEAAGNEFDEEAFDETFYAEEHDTGVIVPEAEVEHPVELTKNAAVASPSASLDLNDIKYFKNAKTINLTGAKIDASTIADLKNATEFNFVACKIDDFAALKDVDFSKIERFSIDISMVPTVTVIGEDGTETDTIDESALEMFKPYGDKVFLAQYLVMQGYGYYPYGEISIADYFHEETTPEETTPEEVTAEEVTAEEVTAEETTSEETPAEITE